MGFDKSAIEINGQPLWRRQLELLQKLNPTELLISGPKNGPWLGSGVTVREDLFPDSGPMGALTGILPHIQTERLLVLAVDLPLMTADFLVRLLQHSSAAVPRLDDYFEPLAAVYARSDSSRLEQFFQTGERSLQNCLRASVLDGKTAVYPVREGERGLFANFNDPEAIRELLTFGPKIESARLLPN